MNYYTDLSIGNLSACVNNVLIQEEWKNVHQYYQISSFGRVKRFKRPDCNNQFKNDFILTQKITKSGYLNIGLRDGKTVKTYRVNRLVAIYFIDNIHNKPQVNHKDGNKLNNSVGNLEWVTGSENQIHSFRVLKRKVSSPMTGKKGKDSHSSKPVVCIETNELFNSCNEAANALSVSNGMISMVCKGKRRIVKGLHFKYA